MAISYVMVTLVLVLLLESVVVAVGFYVFTRSPLVGYWTMHSAWQTAQIYALQAAVHANESALDETINFAPGQASSLSVHPEGTPEEFSWFNLTVPYVEPGTFAPSRPSIALLIDPQEQVVSSSVPDRYPPERPAAEVMPREVGLIRAALAGNADGAVRETAQGTYAAVAYTVWGQAQQPIGAIYIQAPAGVPPNASLLVDVASVVIPSGLLWLCLMLPIGLGFGVLTTRALLKRIERLAGATARFKEGDQSQRVKVSRTDDVTLLLLRKHG
jgi:hypothetical protein